MAAFRLFFFGGPVSKAGRFLLAGEAARELQICNLTLRHWVERRLDQGGANSAGYHLFRAAEIERVKGERQGRKDSGAAAK